MCEEAARLLDDYVAAVTEHARVTTKLERVVNGERVTEDYLILSRSAREALDRIAVAKQKLEEHRRSHGCST